jgi:hypothetical protein
MVLFQAASLIHTLVVVGRMARFGVVAAIAIPDSGFLPRLISATQVSWAVAGTMAFQDELPEKVAIQSN